MCLFITGYKTAHKYGKREEKESKENALTYMLDLIQAR